MLGWLKTILGEGYTEDIEKKVSEEIGKGFVSRADFNLKNETNKTLEGQIKERDKQLEELKKVDATQLQAEITRLQGENTTAKQNFETEVNRIKLDSAMEVALMGAKARDVRAVKPFLNLDLVKLDGDQVLGLEEQLKSIKENKGFLFEEEQKITTKTGMSHQGSTEGTLDKKEEANAAFRSIFGKE